MSFSFASTSAALHSADITAIDAQIDNAISYAQNTGSKISRLSNKYDSMTTRIATTESVRSTIEDADFAEEQMELIKAQIMQQTATAALSQANTAPQKCSPIISVLKSFDKDKGIFMKQKENSYGFQYNGHKRSSRLSSNKRTNGLQIGSKQEATSHKDWRILES